MRSTLRSGAEQPHALGSDPEGAPTEEAQSSRRSGAEQRAPLDPDPEGVTPKAARGEQVRS